LSTIFRNIRYLAADGQSLSEGDVLVLDGVIVGAGTGIGRPDGAEIVEVPGAVLCPGLVDLRASLGEPGFEYR
jgi:dihydroorotase